MVLKYRGAPPFKVPVQTITGEGYSYPGASETTLKRISQVLYRLDISNEDDVRELMSLTGLVENVDWWIVKWSDEGLSDPGTGTDKAVKVRVPAGGSVEVAVRLLYADKVQVLYHRTYVPSAVVVYMQRVGLLTQDVTFPYNGENYSTRQVGNDGWGNYVYYTAHSHSHMWFVKIKFENTGTSDAYVYIAELSLFGIDVGKYWKGSMCAVERDDIAGTTWTFNPVFYTTSRYVPLWITIKLVSDGTNTVSATIYVYDAEVGWKQVRTVSTTSSSGASWNISFIVKDIMRSGKWYAINVKVEVDASSASSAYAHIAFSWIPIIGDEEPDRTIKRLSGSYTSDGNGQTDTVTLLDYTGTSTAVTKHVSRLLRVKATGDSNTTQLQLQVDGEVVWDFLNDGDTCTLDIRDVQKIELLVNDNGSATTTSTTTVNYVVQYEEEDSVICR